MAYTDYALGTLGSEQKISNNDATLTRVLEDGKNDTRLPNGNLVRYKLYSKFHWQFSYSYIYGEKKYVFDGGMGRNDLYTLYAADVAMSFLEPNDQGAQTAYTVRFVANSWQESLLYRDNDKWAYSLSFELVQTT